MSTKLTFLMSLILTAIVANPALAQESYTVKIQKEYLCSNGSTLGFIDQKFGVYSVTQDGKATQVAISAEFIGEEGKARNATIIDVTKSQEIGQARFFGDALQFETALNNLICSANR